MARELRGGGKSRRVDREGLSATLHMQTSREGWVACPATGLEKRAPSLVDKLKVIHFVSPEHDINLAACTSWRKLPTHAKQISRNLAAFIVRVGINLKP